MPNFASATGVIYANGKDAIGTNLYAWCGNNPVNMVDPSGMDYLPPLWTGPSVSPLARTPEQTQRMEYCAAGSPGAYANQRTTYQNVNSDSIMYTGSTYQRPYVKPAPEKVYQFVATPPSQVINTIRSFKTSGFEPIGKAPIKYSEDRGLMIWGSLDAASQSEIYEQYRKRGFIETIEGSPILWQHTDWNKYQKYRDGIDIDWAINCYVSLAQARLEKFYDPISNIQIAECYFEPYGITLNMGPFMYYDYNPVPSGY